MIAMACMLRWVTREFFRREEQINQENISHILQQIENMEDREAKKK
jgi:hypothetical protein